MTKNITIIIDDLKTYLLDEFKKPIIKEIVKFCIMQRHTKNTLIMVTHRAGDTPPDIRQNTEFFLFCKTNEPRERDIYYYLIGKKYDTIQPKKYQFCLYSTRNGTLIEGIDKNNINIKTNFFY